jgi:DNA-binding beta-propeller fold protein YncE
MGKMKVRKLIISVLVILSTSTIPLILFSCRSFPAGGSYFMEEYSYAPIDGISGPEDMVLDMWHTPPRLLVSSDDRRYNQKQGQIYTVDVETNSATQLKREGEPHDLSFHPHGLDIIEYPGGRVILYVINHQKGSAEAEHSVIIYEVFPDRLMFQEILTDPLLSSPNDLAVQTDGSIYVTNDKSESGGMGEIIFRLKRSKVVYFDGHGQWKVAADGLAMANGIAINGEKVYVAATRENAIYSFISQADGNLTDKELFAGVKGPDNFSITGSYLLVGSHTKPMALISHFKDPENKAPSLIYSIHLERGEIKPIFYNDGRIISAASVGVQYRDALYIGQIFDSYILRYSGVFALYKSTLNGIVKKTF